MKAIIPIMSTELRQKNIVKGIPQVMLPIHGKPVIQYLIEEAYHCGIDDIVIVIGPNMHIIQDYFYPSNHYINGHNGNGVNGNGYHELQQILEKIDIFYVYQKPNSTLASALLSARKHIGNNDFAVLLPYDVIFGNESGLTTLIRAYNKMCTSIIGMQYIPQEKVFPYGIINTEYRYNGLFKIKNIVEKSSNRTSYSDMTVIGRYIFRSEFFNYIEKILTIKSNGTQLIEAINELNRDKLIYGVEITGRRFNISRTEDWLLANEFLKSHE